jgi:hypothetical protein
MGPLILPALGVGIAGVTLLVTLRKPKIPASVAAAAIASPPSAAAPVPVAKPGVSPGVAAVIAQATSPEGIAAVEANAASDAAYYAKLQDASTTQAQADVMQQQKEEELNTPIAVQQQTPYGNFQSSAQDPGRGYQPDPTTYVDPAFPDPAVDTSTLGQAAAMADNAMNAMTGGLLGDLFNGDEKGNG